MSCVVTGITGVCAAACVEIVEPEIQPSAGLLTDAEHLCDVEERIKMDERAFKQ